MVRLAAVSVFFVLACSGARRDGTSPHHGPTTVPAEPTEPVAEPSAPGDAGIVSPPPELEPPVDVPHGALRSQDPSLFAHQFPDAGVRIDAGRPDAALGGDAGRDAR